MPGSDYANLTHLDQADTATKRSASCPIISGYEDLPASSFTIALTQKLQKKVQNLDKKQVKVNKILSDYRTIMYLVQ